MIYVYSFLNHRLNGMGWVLRHTRAINILGNAKLSYQSTINKWNLQSNTPLHSLLLWTDYLRTLITLLQVSTVPLILITVLNTTCCLYTKVSCPNLFRNLILSVKFLLSLYTYENYWLPVMPIYYEITCWIKTVKGWPQTCTFTIM